MSRRILKFVVPPEGVNVDTADEPRWLTAAAQGSDIVAWCEAEVGFGRVTRVLGMMTGQTAPPSDIAHYIGSAQQADGIVVHVYHGPARP